MVRWIVLSYPSKNECGGGASALSGGGMVVVHLWPADKILGATAVMRGV